MVIIIEQTSHTPYIEFDKEHGKIQIKGRVLPVKVSEFFESLFYHIDDYINSAPENTELTFHIEVVNTSSSKYMLTLLKKFEHLTTDNKLVFLNWQYDTDDEVMYDYGKYLQSSIGFPSDLSELER